eukprot:CFRG5715T1
MGVGVIILANSTTIYLMNFVEFKEFADCVPYMHTYRAILRTLDILFEEYLMRFLKFMKGCDKIFAKEVEKKRAEKSDDLIVQQMSGSVVSVLKDQIVR